jgi:hypothetical protein
LTNEDCIACCNIPMQRRNNSQLLKMIKIILSIFLISNTLSIFGQTNSTKILIGRWEATDKGRTGKFNFIDNKRIEITYPDGSVDIGTYTFDFKKDPVWFDIVNSNGVITKILKGLIKIENDSTFKWYLSRDGNRPNDYSKPSMVFRKT